MPEQCRRLSELNIPDTLRNQFLIAMPSLADPNFSRTVTLICEHTEEGAMGIVINRPLDLSISEVLIQLSISEFRPGLDDHPVLLGGPVQESSGFVIHQPLGNWGSDLEINPDLGVSASREILQAIARGEGPDNWLLALGYAGWGPGQLESEIMENAWLNGPADHEILFQLPLEQRWRAAAKHLGVDLAKISAESGHA
jgi:putative transcriptional regulator